MDGGTPLFRYVPAPTGEELQTLVPQIDAERPEPIDLTEPFALPTVEELAAAQP